VEAAVAQTAILEVGAVGLGTAVTVAVLSTTLDITGMIAAGTLAVVGFFIIPFKRKQAKDRFKEKMTILRTKLTDALTTLFNDESSNDLTRLKDSVTPYTRYVRAESERIEKAEKTLEDVRQRLSVLRGRSQAVVNTKK
jgi:ABC-type transport system involved in cytochrome bd biosynthesis fused ATPase/permease subunit